MVKIYLVKVNGKFGHSKVFSYFWDIFGPKYIQTNMQNNEQLLSVIENYLAQAELPAEPELLYAPIGYSLSGGGKRLRPMLVMLSAWCAFRVAFVRAALSFTHDISVIYAAYPVTWLLSSAIFAYYLLRRSWLR